MCSLVSFLFDLCGPSLFWSVFAFYYNMSRFLTTKIKIYFLTVRTNMSKVLAFMKLNFGQTLLLSPAFNSKNTDSTSFFPSSVAWVSIRVSSLRMESMSGVVPLLRIFALRTSQLGRKFNKNCITFLSAFKFLYATSRSNIFRFCKFIFSPKSQKPSIIIL